VLKPTHQEQLPVIAIGASAGGLEACRALFKTVSGDTSAAFILILHLDPTHDSLMIDLLADHTGLSVVQAAEGMVLRAGHLHVIPPGMFLTVTQNTLHLSEPESGKGVRLPFDTLLRSVAKDIGASACCVVLSGTGKDGSLGLAEINAAGGLVLVQDPNEARYSGMPDSAIATGLAAHVLRIDQMAAALKRFVDAPRPKASGPPHKPARAAARGRTSSESAPQYDALLAFLRTDAKPDIAFYKRGTLERRIARRMAHIGLGPSETGRYMQVLQSDPQERGLLLADLLIHVTRFFRDPDVFAHLSSTTIPDLIATSSADRPLRIWVAGCSTGEEAYSLAMICQEALDAAGSGTRLQILASDVDPEAIATARAGFFPSDIAAHVSPARLARFFVPENGGWRVTSALRDVIVFTVADLLSDPPFSKIDLASCRNVMIYLGPEAQKRILARCCFALRPGGLLLLGAAEMPGQSDTCFALEDKAARLWRRVGKSHPADLLFVNNPREIPVATNAMGPVRRNTLADLCRRIVLEHYAPAAVLLNSGLDVLYLLGPTENYLSVTQGHPDPGIIGMLPKVLRGRVRAAAATCNSAAPHVVVPGGRKHGGGGFDIALHAVTSGADTLLLACFIDTPKAGTAINESAARPRDDGHKGDLEADLEATRNDLSEALRALEQQVEANGADAAEALSVNEEFQSTNEELLASKEELQSLNEELTALNNQLQETLERHRTTANDLQNVLFSTDVATLFLDLDLKIRFFTPAARTIFRVIPSDIGRPLADLASVFRDSELNAEARAVLSLHDAKEREIEGAAGMWFLRRIQPYRAEGGRVEGIVITYVDITERKNTNAALVTATQDADRATRAKSRFLAAASHDLRQPLQSMVLLHNLLARPKRSSEGARLAKLMDQTLNSMTAMLDSMLDVNRIETGIVKPDMRPVSIAPLMQRLADEFGPLCKAKGLNLRAMRCDVWVLTDPQLLEQILRNLLSNALKYTLKGGILLGCRKRGGQVTIEVHDSGLGVSVSDAKLIFDAYRQGERASALGMPGLGLGLSIVQRLAALMDYPIAVRSTLGKGSTFGITLPIVQPTHVSKSLPARPIADTSKQTGTILMVEDEEPLRDLLAQVLSEEGHNVIAMANAKEALAWASSDVTHPDLLLTDYDLFGGTSGLKLALDLPDILGVAVPTIILTGDITKETLKAIAASPCHQVAKPVMPEVLMAIISDLMQKIPKSDPKTAPRAGVSGMTVHVIDDDPMILETMRRLFEAEGLLVATYLSAEDFLELPRPDAPACLLVDNLLPGMDGVALINLLRAENSQLPVIVLTGHGDATIAVAAMKAGAADFIEKPASAAELLASVRIALKSGKSTGQMQKRPSSAAQTRFAALTARERDVLTRVLQGTPNKIIAADLGINQRTVENHRAAVMRKTEAASLPDLVRLALLAGVQSL